VSGCHLVPVILRASSRGGRPQEPSSESDAADGVGCGDPGKNGYAGGDVEILAPAALSEH
jgi:hypothetical protein